MFRLLVEGFWGESFREDMQAKEVLGRREPRPSRERAEVVRLGWGGRGGGERLGGGGR